MTIIRRSFYARDTVMVAQDLLGKILVRKIGNVTLSGVITETEAYRYRDDPASHAFGGITERNKAMFGRVGMAYVYFTYGMHYCVNAVARSSEFDAGAVLIRSILPFDGVSQMIKNRNISNMKNLANGPAKLTQALAITKNQYGKDLTKKTDLYILDGKDVKKSSIISSKRIGIRKATDRLWNFKLN